MTRTSAGQWAALLTVGITGTAALTWLLVAHTPSTVPLADAVTTVLSLLATWGQCRKKVECWYLWILADVVYVPLYLYKGLTLTALLYVGFLVLCAYGLRAWRSDLAARPALPTAAAPVTTAA